MLALKKLKQDGIQRLVYLDHEKADDNLVDHIKISQMVTISHVLKTLKLLILSINFGYFLGMTWLIMVQISAQYTNQVNFITYENHSLIDDSSAPRWTIITMYFTITSLSTVGFGDFAPRSDVERLLGAVMLLGGVIIFSNCMAKFIEMLCQMKKFDIILEQGE